MAIKREKKRRMRRRRNKSNLRRRKEKGEIVQRKFGGRKENERREKNRINEIRMRGGDNIVWGWRVNDKRGEREKVKEEGILEKGERK